MVMIGAIEFVLRLKDDFTKVLNNSKKKANTTAKSVGDSFKKASLAVKAAWVAVGIILIRVFKDMIDKTKEAEQATARLTQALKNQGFWTEQNIDGLRQLADQLQDTTTFSNDAIVSAMAMLASFQLNAKQIKEMTPLLLDLATMTSKTGGSMMDLESAAKQVGIALGGQPGMLTRMGIKLSDLQTEQLKVAKGQDQINILMEVFRQNAGGLAVAAGETATGAMIQFTNALDDLKKEIGFGLFPALAKIAKFFTRQMKYFNAGMSILAAKATKLSIAFEAIFTKKTFEEARLQWDWIDKKLDEELDKIGGIGDAVVDETGKVSDSLGTQMDAYKNLSVEVSDLEKQRKDLITTIILEGDASGELSIKLKEVNADLAEQTQKIDSVNNALKETDEITNMSMTSFDNLRQKLESQITMMDQWRESNEENRTGLEHTEEEYDNVVQRLEDLENGNWDAVEAAAELNKETGDNFVVANKISKKAAEELDIRLGILTTTTQGFIDKLKEAQSEITNLNAMPINDKTATWTIVIRKVSE